MDKKTLKVLKIFARNRIFGKKGPVQASFQTTTACNLECGYCYADARRPRDRELNTQESKRLFADLKKMNIYVLVFTGGESLLRKDLNDLVQSASNLNLATCLATNGILLTRQKAEELKKLGLTSFHLSIDGSCEEIHAKHKGQGVFKQTLIGLENAVSSALPVIVQTTVTRQNKDDLDNIALLLKKYGVRKWRLQKMVSCGRGQVVSQLENLSKDETLRFMEDAYLLANRHKEKININFHGQHFYNVFLYKNSNLSIWEKFIQRLKGGCSVMEGSIIYINSDGTIRPCPYFPYTLPDTNVREQSIVDIYRHNPLLVKLRNKDNLKGKCRVCKYRLICGGCRAEVFAQTGDFFQEDQNCLF